MKPILFSFVLPWIGTFEFPAYPTLLTVAFLLALWWVVTWAPLYQLPRSRMLDLTLLMVVVGLLGSRLLHVVADGYFHDYVNLCVHPEMVAAKGAMVRHCSTAAQCGEPYLCDALRRVCYPPRDCWAWLKLWRGGLSYYGGFLFAWGAALWYCRRYRLPLLRVADIAAPAMAMGLYVGRLGCWLSGCCFGAVTKMPWGVAFFPPGSPAFRHQLETQMIVPGEWMRPVHPTQLYEAFGCVLAFGVLAHWLQRPKQPRAGQVFGLWLVLYAGIRSFVEIFRADERGVWFGISTSQWLSLPLFFLGLYLLVRSQKRPSSYQENRPPNDIFSSRV